jgi:hypothetical protein
MGGLEQRRESAKNGSWLFESDRHIADTRIVVDLISVSPTFTEKLTISGDAVRGRRGE